VSLVSRLADWNARTEAELAARQMTGPELAEVIAAAIEASAAPCPYQVHPAECAPCARARQARADAELARKIGGLR
jgi:hypothetical protein